MWALIVVCNNKNFFCVGTLTQQFHAYSRKHGILQSVCLFAVVDSGPKVCCITSPFVTKRGLVLGFTIVLHGISRGILIKGVAAWASTC